MSTLTRRNTGRTLIAGAALLALLQPAWADDRTRTQSWDYDTSGFLLKETEEPTDAQLCRVTASHTLDSYGNAAQTTSGPCTSPAPESWMPATTARTSTRTYTDPRFPSSVVNAKGHTTPLTFDVRLGAVSSEKTPNGVVRNTLRDGFGRATQLPSERADNTVSVEYVNCLGSASAGQLDAVNASCGGQTVNGLNGVVMQLGRMVTSTPKSPTGLKNGPMQRVVYDVLDRVVRVSKEGQGANGAAPLIHEDTIYDVPGRVSHRSRPYLDGATTKYWTSYAYDDLDRIVQEVRPDGGSTTYAYGVDAAGTVVTKTVTVGAGKPNQVTREYRNFNGHLTKVTDALGKNLIFTVDAFGNVTQVTNAAGEVEERGYLAKGTSGSYDTRGRVRWTKDPSRGTAWLQYNAFGEMARVYDTATSTTARLQNAYDALGRLSQRTEADLISNWYFDANADGTDCGTGAATSLGLLCQAKAGTGFDEKYVYDAKERQTSATRGTLSLATTYNADGRVQDRTYPSGFKLGYLYTANGYPTHLMDGTSALVSQMQRNADLRLEKMVYHSRTNGDVTSRTFTYSPTTGQLINNAAWTQGVGLIQNKSVAYDWVGNLTSTSGIGGVYANYTYDALNRLQTEVRGGGGLSASQTLTWTYADNGNLLSRSDIGTYAYATAGKPQAVSSIAGVVNGVANPSYTYDARGNRLTGTGSSTTWTSYDLPAASTKGTSRLEWVYGPEHQRAQERYLSNGALQRTTTYFTPPGLDGVGYEEEVAGGGKTQKAYVNLDGESVAVVIHKNGVRDTQYFVKDHLGSTTFVLNASLGAAEQLAYEPFGKRRNSNGVTDTAGTLVASTNDRGYTGHEMLDELSLIHMNGRVYDPAIGRFLSADPHITDPTNAQSYNRYSYVWNNPLNATDPTGLDHWGAEDSSGKLSNDAASRYYGSTNQLATIAAQDVALRLNVGTFDGLGNRAANAWNTVGIFRRGFETGLGRRSILESSTSDEENENFGSGYETGKATRLVRDVLEYFYSPVPGLPAGLSAAAGVVKLGNATRGLPDAALVCRGGACKAENFLNGTGVTRTADGTLSGVSTQSRAGASVSELAKSFKNNQVGVTTAGDIRQAGGSVTADGRAGSPNHATVDGLTAQQLERLFSPTVPNPVPPGLRGF